MSGAYRTMIWVGGAAMLAATSIDTLSVMGRHLGLPVHGSIELIQFAVLVSGSLSLLAATMAGNHARVHFILDRLPSAGRDVAQRICHLASAMFVACLLAGSMWIATDLWHAHEQSELLGLPWAAMRAIANFCLAITLAILVGKILGRAK
jgi:TRAP-type C4-dicarboxylate transport system permease small subunit